MKWAGWGEGVYDVYPRPARGVDTYRIGDGSGDGDDHDHDHDDGDDTYSAHVGFIWRPHSGDPMGLKRSMDSRDSRADRVLGAGCLHGKSSQAWSKFSAGQPSLDHEVASAIMYNNPTSIGSSVGNFDRDLSRPLR